MNKEYKIDLEKSNLDKAIESLVEIELLGLTEDRLEYSIGDLIKGEGDRDREIGIILYTLLKTYGDYRGDIEAFLESLGYSYSIEGLPLANVYTRTVGKTIDKAVDISIGFFLEVVSGKELDNTPYKYTSKEIRDYTDSLLSLYRGYVDYRNRVLDENSSIDEFLDLVRYTYKIEIYPNPIRPE